MNSLTDKMILITGASSGIGQACARTLAAQGAKLILSARREGRLDELCEELTQQYGERFYKLPLDVQNKAQVLSQIDSLPQPWRAIDVLINNAGLALDTLPINEGVVDHWDTMIDTNIKGLLYVSHAVIPGMIVRKEGHIVNIGSIAGHECYPYGNVYSATKHAVHALSKSMRLDLLGKSIRVTEIAPGAVETEFSEVRWKDKQKADAFYESFKPLLPENIADSILYCLSCPAHMTIEQMIIMPTIQASANHLLRDMTHA